VICSGVSVDDLDCPKMKKPGRRQQMDAGFAVVLGAAGMVAEHRKSDSLTRCACVKAKK
jgi:hypothetical protein